MISVKKLTDVSKKDPTPWYCKLCIRAKLLFCKLNNTEFARLTKNRTMIYKKQVQESFSLLEKLNQFSENENLSCKYYNNKHLKELRACFYFIWLFLLYRFTLMNLQIC